MLAPVADILALVLLIVAFAVAVGGGFRMSDAIVHISVLSPWMPLLLALGLIAIRHAVVRRPTAVETFAGWMRQLSTSDGWRAAWAPFLVSRLMVVVIGLLAVYTIGIAPNAPPLRVSETDALNLPVRWDAGWYLSIARNGYMWTPRDVGKQQNVAFFPALPMAMRLVGRIFGASGIAYIYAGVVVSHVAFLWALMLLYQLARDDLGDSAAAAAAVLLLASYPFSIFYGAVYTESFFLLAAVGAVLEFQRERWGPSIMWGLLAGLTRPNGCLLAFTIATLAVTRHLTRRAPNRSFLLAGQLGAIAAPVVGAAAFWLFLWDFTGSPFRWSEQHEAWGRTFEGFEPFVKAGAFAAEYGVGAYLVAHIYDVLNAVPTLLALAVAIPIGLRLGWAYPVFIVSNIVPPLVLGGFLSTGRFTSTLFPLFIWLGALTRRSTPIVVLIFAMLQGLLAALFYTWRPAY